MQKSYGFRLKFGRGESRLSETGQVVACRTCSEHDPGYTTVEGVVVMKRIKLGALVCFFSAGMAGWVPAADFHQLPGSLKYPGCEDVKKANFTSVTLLSVDNAPELFEPTRFNFTKSGRIFFLERNGGIRVIEKDGSVVKVGSVTTFPTTKSIPGNNELGLVGMQLDPGFESNGWIYLVYQPPTPAVTKISRFTVSGQTLVAGSEQNLMTFPNQRNFCCHTGGDMQFDNKGDLWISSGNNTKNSSATTGYVDESNPDMDDQAHAANTNDYRGKILRIHPLPAPGPDGKLYSIPAGNMQEYYASIWSADEKAKVLPEIYTMGHRSNYTISVDTVTGWLTWGDIGPDEHRLTEELNVATKPGFYGWPYFAGSKRNDAGDAYLYHATTPKDEAAPMNNSRNNTGAKLLPPAIPAAFGYRQSAAITGPIYHWNARQTGAKKLPAHFDGKWLISDYNAGELQVATLDANANMTTRTTLMDGLTRPIDIEIGPDGYLYTLEYGTNNFVTDGKTKLKRWEYNGPACASVSIADKPKGAGARSPGMLVNLGVAARTVPLPPGMRGYALFDMQGKQVWASQDRTGTDGTFMLSIPNSVPEGLYRALLH
jgi:cytochrome c